MRPDDQRMEHVDEGTVHAWLDGALDAAESAQVEAHVASCADCGAVVAEARGLIAGASRILMALDDVPGDVIPTPEPAVVPITRARRPRSWVPIRAAAAVVVMAGAAGLVLTRRGADRPLPAASEVRFSADSAVATPMAARPATIASEPAGGVSPTPPVRLAAPSAPPAAMDSAAMPSAASSRREESAPARADGAGAAAGVVAQAPLATAQASLAKAQASLAEAPRSDAMRRIAGNAAGAAPAPAAPPFTPMERRASADLTTAGTGTIVGAVTDERDRPLADASVVIERSATQSATDSAGRFVLRDVAAGPTTVRARRIGFTSADAVVDVRPADTARLALRLSTATLQLSQVVVAGTAAPVDTVRRGVAGGVARGAARAARADERARERADAGGPVVGCYAVRLDGAAAPRVPARVRLTAGGGAGTVRWTRDTSGALRVTLADTTGTVVLTLAPTAGGWAGRATVPNATGTSGVSLSRLAGCEPD